MHFSHCLCFITAAVVLPSLPGDSHGSSSCAAQLDLEASLRGPSCWVHISRFFLLISHLLLVKISDMKALGLHPLGQNCWNTGIKVGGSNSLPYVLG